MVAVALVIAGVVVISRAPSSSGDAEMVVVTSAIFLVFTAALVTLALGLLVTVRRSQRLPGAAVAGVCVVAALAAFPVERVWFENEHSRGPVPLVQSLTMQRLSGPGDDFPPPALRYSEVCCE